MADIRSMAAEIRRGKKKIEEEDRRKKLQGKNIMAPLLHRAAIKNLALTGSVSGEQWSILLCAVLMSPRIITCLKSHYASENV